MLLRQLSADAGAVETILFRDGMLTEASASNVFLVRGGPYGEFDLPAVRAFIRIFAPRRGEIVVDADSLDLRPARSRTPDPDRPKAPRRRSRKPNAAVATSLEPPIEAPAATDLQP